MLTRHPYSPDLTTTDLFKLKKNLAENHSRQTRGNKISFLRSLQKILGQSKTKKHCLEMCVLRDLGILRNYEISTMVRVITI